MLQFLRPGDLPRLGYALAPLLSLAVLSGSGRPCPGIILAGIVVAAVVAIAPAPISPVVVTTTAVIAVIPFMLRYNRTGKSLGVTVLIIVATHRIDSHLDFLKSLLLLFCPFYS